MTKKNIEEMERRERVERAYKENCNNKEYQIPKEEFEKWLENEGEKESFIKALKEIKEDIITVYDTAFDYSITISLVKFFMKEYL